MLYVLPVLFGVMAACAGGIAWHRPGAGLGVLFFTMVGYIAASVPLVRVIETRRANRLRPAVSLVRGGRRGQHAVGRDPGARKRGRLAGESFLDDVSHRGFRRHGAPETAVEVLT